MLPAVRRRVRVDCHAADRVAHSVHGCTRPVRHGFGLGEIYFGIGDKFRCASGAAEIVWLSGMFCAVGRRGRVDHHAADGIARALLGRGRPRLVHAGMARLLLMPMPRMRVGLSLGVREFVQFRMGALSASADER
jgi:hypothetical protein